MDRYLEGQHAIITGGSRGIGAAIAESFSALGARLTLMSRSPTATDTDDRRHVACDVSSESSVVAAFAKAVDGLGPASILVNNAGIANSSPLSTMTRATWDEMIGTNLTGTFLCSAQVVPSMVAAKRGRIINMASTAGLRGYKMLTAYCAAKHGVIGFTRALSMETAKHGVTVNAVCPGYTDTDMISVAIDNLVNAFGKTPEEARAMLVSINPRGVMTTAAEVAAAVAWLCAPTSVAITGIALPVAGGEVQ